MVYCGKPSRGCQMCRTRRIKCDETKPTCNQCAKSRRQCPGYKDEFDLLLRNETQATERRAKRAGKKAIAGHGARQDQQTGSADSSPVSIQSTVKGAIKSPFDLSIVPALEIPTETRASCHFVSNFVLIPNQGGTRGYLDYLGPLLKTEQVDSALHHAFNACALASLGNRVSAPNIDFSGRAYDEYLQAIRATNVALRDAEASKSDATLAAVLLMGLFENITASKAGEFAWGSHIEGAISITKARGRKQLRTKLGLLLFIAVRTQLTVYALSSAKPVAMGTDWWLNDAVKDKLAAASQRINLKTGELRAEVARVMTGLERIPENIDRVLAIIRRAQLLDQEAVGWMNSLPESWQYKTLCWEDHVPGGDYSKAEVFPGRVDVYSDFWIASVWNLTRATRLVLAAITIRCAAWVCWPVDYRTTPEYATASQICVNTIADIIASVPYHLGWHTKRKHLFANIELSGFACGEESSSKSLPGYFLIWPLTCLITQDHATDAQRQWVSGRLRYIGDELGLKYSKTLSKLAMRIPSMLIRIDVISSPSNPKSADEERLLHWNHGRLPNVSAIPRASQPPASQMRPIEPH